MTNWISVKERLPEPYVRVLCYYSGRGGVRISEMFGSVPEFGLETMYGKVTHWMPLPEPPKGDK